MSLDCTSPDDPELQQLQAVFDASGQTFREMAQPYRFETDSASAWAWYGHRQRLYQQMQPHDGYRSLRAWAQATPCGGLEAPDGHAVITFGIGRRAGDATRRQDGGGA